MAECPYCLEAGTHFISVELDPVQQVEVEVVDCLKPYLMIRGYHRQDLYADWSVGIQIKHCPMCGRRLGNG